MKIKRIAGTCGAILALLAVAIACVVLFWLGPTVKLLAEKIGSKALGTPLTIRHLAIDPRAGTVELTGFAIANPSQFGRSTAVSLASLNLAFDLASVLSETVVVHRVEIQSPHFVYEQGEASDNVAAFIRNIQSFAGIDPEHPAKPEEKEPADVPSDGSSKVVVVEALALADLQFHLANTDDPALDFDIGLELLQVSMTNGAVHLGAFHVSNPERLATPNLFALEGIDIAMDPASLYSGRPAILDVHIRKPYAYLERNPETDTVAEFIQIARRIAARIPKSDAPAPALPEPAPPAEKDSDIPFELHHLLVDDVELLLLDATQTNSAGTRMLAGIGSIRVRLTDGELDIHGVAVPNPPGFTATNLFQLGRIETRIDPATLFSGRPLIKSILIDSPRINLQQTPAAGNLSELQKTIMDFVPVPTSAPEAAPPTAEPEPAPAASPPLVVQSIEVTNLLVSLSLPAVTNEAVRLLPGMAQWEKLELRERASLDLFKPGSKAPNTQVLAASEVEQGAFALLACNRIVAQPTVGQLDITQLRVGNPPGFANADLVALDSFHLKLDPTTLAADTLLIEEILLERPEVDYERKILTDNIRTLRTSIEGAIARREQEKGTIRPPSDAAEGEAQKVIIGHLLVQNGKVRAKLSALPSAPIPLPKIERRDIGKTEGGASWTAAWNELFNTFYDAIIGSVSSTSGFAVDALKGAGALTFDTLGAMTGGTSDKLLNRNARPQAEEAPGETSPSTKNKKRRSLFHKLR